MKHLSIGVIWQRTRGLLALASFALLAACGSSDSPTVVTPTPVDPMAMCNETTDLNGDINNFQNIVSAVPKAAAVNGVAKAAAIPAGTVRFHYNRTDKTYTGWQIYTYNPEVKGWPGIDPTGTDEFGVYWDVAVGSSASVNFIIHKGDSTREPSNWSGKTGTDQQQYWKVADGAEVWKLEGDATNYTVNPKASGPKDITTLRVHYKRFDSNFAVWGLHMWDGGGIDVSKLPPAAVINNWDNPVLFNVMTNYAQEDAANIVFDIPVISPAVDATKTGVEFIIHGTSANTNGGTGNKDGWSDNIKVSYAAVTVTDKIGHIWLVQGQAAVNYAKPDTRSVSTTDASAFWLTKSLLQFPHVDSTGVFKLYYSSKGAIVAAKDAKITGADGSVTLTVGSTADVPAAAATRFKYIDAGVVLKVADADVAKLSASGGPLTGQVLLVQEDADGKVQNATTAQIAGALDDIFSAATSVNDLGVNVAGGKTNFKVWAPTAQSVSVCSYATGSAKATAIDSMTYDATTGVWSLAKSSDLTGNYYTYIVTTFVKGVGIVQNRVVDPYSISLTTNSLRSYIANLSDANLKPAGWDTETSPTTVTKQTDMSIYELHVRDFSINDSTVSAANRGKFLAFTETGSNGMKHLKALADNGLTDVHLLPMFDFATVPESGCEQSPVKTTSPAPDSTAPQAEINTVADKDCFNWGYDPYTYTSPEGSYASDAADGAKRIIEFRQAVQAMHAAGLRVGMDVVYNHTTASGQALKSVLDRIVPGYYHRLSTSGNVLTNTCCQDTAAENAMMAKLLKDSTKTWATQYHVDSFRFDLMGFHPASVMTSLKTELKTTAGRDIFLLGEGWNYGDVANGARFVQASQLSLNGTGIATFSDRARDAIRGGGCCDSGASLLQNQGYINGAFYDPNGTASQTNANLMTAGDMVKVGLAGSIRSYNLVINDGSTKKLEEVKYGNDPAGYVQDPIDVVNYMENHDNRTLFDINVLKMPVASSTADRARVQGLAMALNMFSQGVAYFHAGVDTLRSKSLDGDSYNSGDWFNRLDWTYTTSNFGVGLPNINRNESSWETYKPFLQKSATIAPAPADIAFARDEFLDLLAIRKSTPLFRLTTAADVSKCVKFYNTGATQVSTVIVGALDGVACNDANYSSVIYLVNVDKAARTITIGDAVGKSYVVHPAHKADVNGALKATFTSGTGAFTVPARTAVVFVMGKVL